ncbi:unnamed protein product [Choristocarpus tenellus]
MPVFLMYFRRSLLKVLWNIVTLYLVSPFVNPTPQKYIVDTLMGTPVSCYRFRQRIHFPRIQWSSIYVHKTYPTRTKKKISNTSYILPTSLTELREEGKISGLVTVYTPR